MLAFVSRMQLRVLAFFPARIASAIALSLCLVPVLLFTIPIFSTLLGGSIALRFRQHATLLVAVGAGILLGAAFLDLLPEALSLAAATGIRTFSVLTLTLLSYLLFLSISHALDSFERRVQQSKHSQWLIRRAAASMLIFHSFRDGMAIGAAYSASHNAGYAVALGIAAHDVGDGLNTVLLTCENGSSRWSTYLFLLADALAPFLGGLLTVWWAVSEEGSILLLVLAAGFFLQLATSDFLPQIWRSKQARGYLLPAVLLGVGLIYAANLLLGRNH